MADNCVACDVNSGLIKPPGGPIHVDELWQADHELTPLLRGYLILKPRRHVHHLGDLTLAEAERLGPLLKKLTATIRSVLMPERVYVASFAETVHHVHFHLIPRYAEMPALGPGLMSALFAGDWACEVGEAEAAAAAIRGALEAA